MRRADSLHLQLAKPSELTLPTSHRYPHQAVSYCMEPALLRDQDADRGSISLCRMDSDASSMTLMCPRHGALFLGPSLRRAVLACLPGEPANCPSLYLERA